MKINTRHDTFRVQDAKTLEEANARIHQLANHINDISQKSNNAYAEIEQQFKKSTQTAIAASGGSSGGGGGSPVSMGDPPAQSVTISAVADTTIPFLTPVPVQYVVRAWMYDVNGSPSDVWIADADLAGNSFIVRASQLTGTGTLYYQVSRKA